MTSDEPEPRHGAKLVLVTFLVAVVMFIDGYDLQVMALLIPSLADEFGTGPSDFGIVLSAAVAGLGIGARSSGRSAIVTEGGLSCWVDSPC